MFTYFLVFEYTADRHSFFLNKVITQNKPFSVDDVEIQEKQTTKENENRKVRLVFFNLIEPSQNNPSNLQ